MSTDNVLIIVDKGKATRWRSGTRYSTVYVSQTQDQKRLTILVVAADRHELMIPRCIVWPSIVHASSSTCGAACRPTTPQLATQGFHPIGCMLLLIAPGLL